MLELIVKELAWHKKIQVIRTINGWNQVEAASKCLTHQKMYWLWEKGKSYPQLANRKAIARACGLKIEDIFSVHDVVVGSSKSKKASESVNK
jgi:DNA-binding XRE family transcriptional regulator